ncbi:ubiquitin C-terminal hydrolase 12-like [Juglans microcarpa x Juglans regia]|uniref:ubiquitin C-terminal hydrolase 12-like n=1 Tax=Juglans microcarpa x Juglans regia TaxID=2249226 RepID=UPI001B7F6364|nr:ubiquitin C-terminal hydrolase 12-like [Juglans microcarpa x Juglans regia]
MELDNACHSLPADIDTNGVVRSSRDLPPADYTFQIKNFSVLFEAEVEKCESGQFEVGGYNWRLVLKTNGKKNSKNHISLYLAIINQSTLSLGWEANVTFRFFVFDQIRNKYLCIQDADGSVRRFHNLKTEWGFAQLLSHDTLNDPSNGYIVDDSCILGAEVFVIKGSGRGVCLSMIKQPQTNYFSWRVDNLDERKDKYCFSDEFSVEGRKCSDVVGLDAPTNWFLRDLKDPSNGYLVDDALFVECKIDVISEVKDFSG